jgi:hypothetical protein
MTPERKITILGFTTFGALAGLAAMIYIHFFTEPPSSFSFVDDEGQEIKLTRDEAKELLQFNDEMNLENEEILEEWRKKRGVHPDTTGGWLTDDDAYTKLDHFTRWNNGGIFRKQIRPFAYAFGSGNLKKLLSRMDSINTNHLNSQPDSLKIQGVRVYLSFSKIESKKTRHLDVMMVPVLGNGNNYVAVSGNRPATSTSATTTRLVLNTSSPCPDNCTQ